MKKSLEHKVTLQSSDREKVFVGKDLEWNRSYILISLHFMGWVKVSQVGPQDPGSTVTAEVCGY